MLTDLDGNFVLDNSSHLLANQYTGASGMLVCEVKELALERLFLTCFFKFHY